MQVPRRRRIHYEDVPADMAASFTLREFRWPAFPFNWHYHPEVELTLITKGGGLRFVGDSVDEFSEGDLCLIGGSLPHTWASSSKQPRGVCSLVIQFQPSNWGDSFWRLPEFQEAKEMIDLAHRGLRIDNSIRDEIARMMLALPEQPHGSWLRFRELLTILCLLAKSGQHSPLASDTYEPVGRPNADKRLGNILSYIHANLGPDLTQERTAKAVKLSPPALSRFFKRSLGKTFVGYVNDLKIREACRALIETGHTIAEVAFASGFNNLSHFNEQFLRHQRRTPSEFRSQTRDQVSHAPLSSASDWMGAMK